MSIFIRNKYSQRSWSEIFFEFWDLAKERLDVEMKRRRKNAIKTFLSLLFLIVGIFYFIDSIAALINNLFGNSWAGQLVVGLLLMAVGILFTKK